MKAISDSLIDPEEANAEGEDAGDQGTIEQSEEAQEDKSKDSETE
jgi:hypothetical protein